MCVCVCVFEVVLVGVGSGPGSGLEFFWPMQGCYRGPRSYARIQARATTMADTAAEQMKIQQGETQKRTKLAPKRVNLGLALTAGERFWCRSVRGRGANFECCVQKTATNESYSLCL